MPVGSALVTKSTAPLQLNSDSAEPHQTSSALREEQSKVQLIAEECELTDPEPEDRRNIYILYIFCGIARKGDIAHWLRHFAREYKADIEVVEIDLCRGGESHDLTSPVFIDSITADIKRGKYSAALITPPCNTHSRARSANKWGPPPLRSNEFPFGFPDLLKHQKTAVAIADNLIEVSF